MNQEFIILRAFDMFKIKSLLIISAFNIKLNLIFLNTPNFSHVYLYYAIERIFDGSCCIWIASRLCVSWDDHSFAPTFYMSEGRTYIRGASSTCQFSFAASESQWTATAVPVAPSGTYEIWFESTQFDFQGLYQYPNLTHFY